MKQRTLLSLMLLFVAFGYSQNIPTLKVKDKPLGLSSLDIKVDVVGNIATTTYDMLFYNPTNAILEGQLDFPLGDGHNVSRFALDVNGKLRDAVVVDKELGRIAFEDVVRRQVDPALLEKGTGNNYKARIYPIPAKGYKRVVLAYEQELLYKEDANYYNLPLNFKNKLDDFTLEITVFEQKSKPVIEKGQISGLQFSNWDKNFKTTISKKNYIPNNSLLIKIPMPIDAEKILVYDNYFYAYKTLSPKKRLRFKPKNITIYWDASLSTESRNLEKELSLLEAYFSEIKNVDVSFIAFSNTVLKNTSFTIQNGNWNTLKEEIQNTIYDGATNYDVIYNLNNTTDVSFLFSDGMASLSDYNFKTSKPLFVVNSLVKSNFQKLNQLAELSNGAYVNLNTLSESEAFKLITYEPYKFISYSTNSSTLEMYPKGPKSIDNDFSIAGKNLKNGDIVTLNFGFGNKITQSIDLKIKTSENANSMAKRLWAQQKLNALASNSKANKSDITQLGIDYSLVTDYTSLIVLENVMDYVRYKITPPEELQEEYNKLLAEIEQREKEESTISNAVSLRRRPSANAMVSEDDWTPSQGTLSDFMNEDETTINFMTAPNLMDLDEEIIEVEEMRLEEPSDDTLNSAVSLSRERQDSKKYTGKLVVKERTLDTDYIKALSKTKSLEDAYKFYLEQRKDYLKMPSYYSDVSTYFQKRFDDTIYASRILSNIAETDFDDYELLKVYAYQLQLNYQNDLAVFIFQRILELRPEDSQSYRDLALAYQKTGKCQEALDLFNSIITEEIYKNSKRRIFPGMQLIAQNEIKHLIQNYKDDLDLSSIDKESLAEINLDIRVVVDWNHNDTDIDLHIIDPNLEECFYSHPKTKLGGIMSPDMTQGFGPEEFVLEKAKKGDYFVKIKYYGDRYQKADNPTFMKVTIYKYYGTNRESKEIKMIRLTNKDEFEMIAKVTI
ncbi:VIT domain-containing protein [Psychroserpens luteus]|uniref:VIT domain-containing protein n=1 Tax=Psychroserpens luteus TaxID=1434066 RepID=A0ABW5ZTC4_9FLAO|nr:VIT domain-containing protein [Psychroserpens luteus]